METAIKVKNVTKKFRIYQEKNSTLKERLVYAGRTKFKEFFALDNVSVDIPKGKTVGLIGKNGSGKSTLLKLISRILYPNSGEIKVYGRVSSLLELGAGFHPDFTGRENIYMNASIMGLSKKEIDKKLNEIISFSELEDFIDNPVRSYSSGMYTRLAFSVAISVEPDILLIDEVLAVGDYSFQIKCLDRIKLLKNAGVTIVIVSHDHNVIKELCDLVVWLKHGKIMNYGNPNEVVEQYLEDLCKVNTSV
ncbi:ABC transporter ATP-binding protein [Fodinisporobacter ferrooxydans]|uniref:ABC transporter ATP-binding protein n=1 Tax=Fodinisporobacter ferrooxydans TaxID=2901836 RepID=A0ABY4CMG2_9BACL|nr:ABC transporter ATP-binding protein [Alicyclobacillaceae bacterium MYW30-H2]